MTKWERFKALFCSCEGKGVYYVRGEQIPRDQLSPQEQAELMVNGGAAYERVERVCPKHGR